VYRYNRNHRLWHDYICYQLCLSPVAESIPEELVVLRKLRLEFGLPVRSIISIGPFLRSRQRVRTQREPQETRGANAPTADKNQESTQGAS
ncbi:MAG: hypothetical protein NZL89_03515, partial [Leptospiraceae bacterium]|nr:hypothetical protein [Leptospiraceae bacterium]